jgi:nitrate reductase gamma subunit
MNEAYLFLTGPALWISFVIFIGGLVVRTAFYIGLSRERDKVFYNHFDWGWSLRSIFAWLVPLGSVSWRQQPVFALVVWVFHLGLLGVPLFLEAHNILFEEAWDWSLPTLPAAVADWGTLVVIACGVFLILRRLVRPEVRLFTSAWDYFLLLLVMSPFVTGYLAYHQYGDYELMLVLHILLSEVLLVIIPFSKLGHMILFFFTRAFIASEMGARREVDGRLGARTW